MACCRKREGDDAARCLAAIARSGFLFRTREGLRDHGRASGRRYVSLRCRRRIRWAGENEIGGVAFVAWKNEIDLATLQSSRRGTAARLANHRVENGGVSLDGEPAT